MLRFARSAWTLAMNDLRVVRRDRVGLFFMVGFPILMGLFFSYLMGDGGGNGKSSRLRIAVVDEDGSPSSASLIKSLKEGDGVELEARSRDAAISEVRQGKLLAAAIIPQGYGATAGLPWREGPSVEVVMDPSRKAEAGMLQGLFMRGAGQQMFNRFQDPAAFQTMIEELRTEMDADPSLPLTTKAILQGLMSSLSGLSTSLREVRELPSEDPAKPNGGLDAMRLMNVKFSDVTELAKSAGPRPLLTKIRSSWDLTYPQSSIWGVLACSAGFATLLVRERERGTQLRLFSSPVSRRTLLAGKGLACYLAICFVITTMTGVAFLMGLRPLRWDLLVLAILAIAACFVGVMSLVANVGRTEKSVSGAAWGCNMILAMFGGGMIPLAFMSGSLRTLSHFDPVKWAVLALEGAVWREFTFWEMLPPLAVLLGIGGLTGALGVWLMTRAKGP